MRLVSCNYISFIKIFKARGIDIFAWAFAIFSKILKIVRGFSGKVIIFAFLVVI